MQNDQLKWCSEIKDGLKLTDPNERISLSYMNEAKTSLERAQKNFNDGDLLWTTVVIYYAEYYALYSFLQRIGIKCENHFCSILMAEVLLGKDKIATINEHKEKRIDAQYYIKFGKDKEVEKMLNEAKLFISSFDEIVSGLSEKDIGDYRTIFEGINP